MKIFSLAFLAVVSFGCKSQQESSTLNETTGQETKLDLSEVKLDKAYKSTDGKLFLTFRVDYNNRTVPDWIRYKAFWGSVAGLHAIKGGSGSSGGGEFRTSYGDAVFQTKGKESLSVLKDADVLKDGTGEEILEMKELSYSEMFKLLRKIRSGEIKLHNQPSYKSIEYVFKRQDGKGYILVEGERPEYSYDFEVLMSDENGKIKTIETENVMRYRDGGTTVMVLKNGMNIFSPTPFKPAEKAKLSQGRATITELEKVEKQDRLAIAAKVFKKSAARYKETKEISVIKDITRR